MDDHAALRSSWLIVEGHNFDASAMRAAPEDGDMLGEPEREPEEEYDLGIDGTGGSVPALEDRLLSPELCLDSLARID